MDLHYIKPIYLISNTGVIKNKNTGRIIKEYSNEKGYSVVMLMTFNGRNKGFKVHRLVAGTFIENLDNKPQVNHKDGRKYNNNVSNLEWVTISQNVIHSYANHLNVPRRGSLNGMNKYNEDVIIRIWELIQQGYGTRLIRKDIKTQFDTEITRYLVSDIKNGKSWTHITKL